MEEVILTKACCRCNKLKPVESSFYKNFTTKDGYAPACKECTSKRTKELSTPETKAKKSAIDRKYREENREQIRAQKKEAGSTPEAKAKKAVYDKEHAKEYLPIRREKVRVWYINKIHSDPVYRLIANARRRITNFLKGEIKGGHAVELVGCSGEVWLKYLESTFWPGMTLANDGPIKWEVDHVIPLDAFDKTEPGWQFKAFHWSNTQALWADDNRSKRHRLDWSHTESKHELPEHLKRLDKTYWSVILEPKEESINV